MCIVQVKTEFAQGKLSVNKKKYSIILVYNTVFDWFQRWVCVRETGIYLSSWARDEYTWPCFWYIWTNRRNSVSSTSLQRGKLEVAVAEAACCFFQPVDLKAFQKAVSHSSFCCRVSQPNLRVRSKLIYHVSTGNHLCYEKIYLCNLFRSQMVFLSVSTNS